MVSADVPGTPTVTDVTSAKANGAYTTGELIVITIEFSEPVFVTGNPYLELETGTTDQNATYNDGNGTDTLTFEYTVQAGDTSSDLDYKATNSLNLNSGTIRDDALTPNDADLTLASPGTAGSLGDNKDLIIDTTAPAPPSTPNLAAADDSGSSDSDNITNKTSGLTISGTAEIDSTVELFDGTASKGTTTATGGNWSMDISLANGVHSITAKATDAAGNTSAASSALSITVDTTAPDNQDTVFASGVTKKGGASVTIASSGEPTNNVWFAPSGTTSFAASATMTTAGGTATTIPAPANAGEYKLFVIDAAGNISSASTATLTVENTAPTAAITYSVPGPYKQGDSVTITATFSEAMASSPAVKIVISGANNLSATNMSRTNSTHYTYVYTIGPGTGTATIALSTGTDLAGNMVVSAPTSGATFNVDNTSPTAAITYSPSGPYKEGDSVTITASFSEVMAVSPAVRIAISGIHTLSATDMTRKDGTHYTYVFTAGSGDGTAQVSLSTGTDLLGNVITSEPTSGAIFIVANTMPTAAITYSAPGPYKKGDSVTITATFSKEMAVSPAVRIAISGAQTLTSTNMTRTNSTHYTYVYTAGSGEGTATVSLSNGKDTEGNVIISTPSSGATFTVDNTTPTNQDTVFASSVTRKGGASITIGSSGDPTDNIWFAPSGTTSFEPSSVMTSAGGTATTIHTPSNEGTYKLFVVDAAGNISSASTATLTVENVAPTAAITYSVPGPYKAGDSFTITATFSEAMASSLPVRIATSGVSVLSATNMTRKDSTHYTYDYTIGSGDGTVMLALSTGTDLAGNEIISTPTSGATFTVETEAPTAAITYSMVGLYKAGDSVTITATFSEPMANSPVIHIAISGANTLSATDMTKVDSTHYTYEYTIGPGNGTMATVSLSTGTDLVGNVITSKPTSGATFAVTEGNESQGISLWIWFIVAFGGVGVLLLTIILMRRIRRGY